jgi:hypothetical protein
MEKSTRTIDVTIVEAERTEEQLRTDNKRLGTALQYFGVATGQKKLDVPVFDPNMRLNSARVNDKKRRFKKKNKRLSKKKIVKKK